MRRRKRRRRSALRKTKPGKQERLREGELLREGCRMSGKVTKTQQPGGRGEEDRATRGCTWMGRAEGDAGLSQPGQDQPARNPHGERIRARSPGQVSEADRE